MTDHDAMPNRVLPGLYTGLWSILVNWFRVPDAPPEPPGGADRAHHSFRPDRGFLSLLRAWCAIALALTFLGIIVVCGIVMIEEPLLGVVLLVVLLGLALLAIPVAWVAIHLRYDTTWFVATDRSLRIRRGVLDIREMTFTYENIQNVKVTQGPLQRWFGISNLVVETAGAGQAPKGGGVGNSGVIEGIRDAAGLRERILDRLRAAGGAGLGDDAKPAARGGFGSAHVAVLREILEEVRRLPAG